MNQLTKHFWALDGEELLQAKVQGAMAKLGGCLILNLKRLFYNFTFEGLVILCTIPPDARWYFRPPIRASEVKRANKCERLWWALVRRNGSYLVLFFFIEEIHWYFKPSSSRNPSWEVYFIIIILKSFVLGAHNIVQVHFTKWFMLYEADVA